MIDSIEFHYTYVVAICAVLLPYILKSGIRAMAAVLIVGLSYYGYAVLTHDDFFFYAPIRRFSTLIYFAAIAFFVGTQVAAKNKAKLDSAS